MIKRARRALALLRPQGPLILAYHRIATDEVDPWHLCVSQAHFQEHLEILKRRRVCLPLREFVERARTKSLPPNAVAVTFDDGYADNLHAAHPLLAQFEVPATVFVTSGAVGANREFWWDELEQRLLRPGRLPATLELDLGGRKRAWALGTSATYSQQQASAFRGWRASDAPPTARHALYYELWQLLQKRRAPEQARVLDALAEWSGIPAAVRNSHRAMTAGELGKMAASGLIEIGAHTVTHPVLPGLSEDEQLKEMMCSKSECEAIIGRPVTMLSYPHGSNEEPTRDLARTAGFNAACGAWVGAMPTEADLFNLPRTAVHDMNGATLVRKVIGGL